MASESKPLVHTDIAEEGIIKDNLQKEFVNLNNYLPTVEASLDSLSKKLLTVAKGFKIENMGDVQKINDFLKQTTNVDKISTDLKKINRDLLDQAKIQTQLAKAAEAKNTAETKELKNKAELKLKEEELAQAQLKTAAQQKKNADQQLASQQKLIAQAEKEAQKVKLTQDAYGRLNKEYNIAARNAKNLAAEFGRDSEQAKKAAATAFALNAELVAIDETVGRNERKVGGYFQAFTKFYSFLRVAANIIPGLGISGIILLGWETLVALSEKLTGNLFKSNNLILENIQYAESQNAEHEKRIELLDEEARLLLELKALKGEISEIDAQKGIIDIKTAKELRDLTEEHAKQLAANRTAAGIDPKDLKNGRLPESVKATKQNIDPISGNVLPGTNEVETLNKAEIEKRKNFNAAALKLEKEYQDNYLLIISNSRLQKQLIENKKGSGEGKPNTIKDIENDYKVKNRLQIENTKEGFDRDKLSATLKAKEAVDEQEHIFKIKQETAKKEIAEENKRYENDKTHSKKEVADHQQFIATSQQKFTSQIKEAEQLKADTIVEINERLQQDLSDIDRKAYEKALDEGIRATRANEQLKLLETKEGSYARLQVQLENIEEEKNIALLNEKLLQEEKLEIIKKAQVDEEALKHEYYVKQIEEARKMTQAVVGAISDGLQRRAEVTQQADQKNINQHERQIDIQTKLAAEGRNNVLGAEIAASEKAEAKKLADAKKAAKQQEGFKLASLILDLTAAYAKAGNTDSPEFKALAVALTTRGLANAIAGSAYDGVSDTGGAGNVDNKGGKMWILHPHEGIVKREANERYDGAVGAMNDGTFDQWAMDNIYRPQFKAANTTTTQISSYSHDQVLGQIFERKFDALKKAFENKPTPSVKLGRLGEWTEEIQTENQRVIINHLYKKERL